MKTPKIQVKHTMLFKKYATSIPIITTLLLAIVSYIGVVYAINSAITGWSVAPSSITDITLIDTTCRRVTNNAVSTNNRYIPTTTMAEWNSFALAAPTHGIGIGICGSYTYSWIYGSYGSCSASCGGGIQIAPTICQRSDGVIVADIFCNGTKPADMNIACNTIACGTSGAYTLGTWGTCTGACGTNNATQTRTVSCGYTTCTGPSNTTQACTASACATSGPYSYTPWGSCSASCGGGAQSRIETCNYSSCYSPQATSQLCNTTACCNPTNMNPEPGKSVSYGGYPFYWNGSQWDIDCGLVACVPGSFSQYDSSTDTVITTNYIKYDYSGNISYDNVFWSYPNLYHINWNTYQWEYAPTITCN